MKSKSDYTTQGVMYVFRILDLIIEIRAHIRTNLFSVEALNSARDRHALTCALGQAPQSLIRERSISLR